VDEHELACTVVPCELDGITTIVFALVAGALGNEGWGREFAGDAPVREGPLEDIACAGGFVASTDGAGGGEASEVAT